MTAARTVTIGLSEDQARWIDDHVAMGAEGGEALLSAALDERMLREAISRRGEPSEGAVASGAPVANDEADDIELDAFFDGMAERLRVRPNG